MKRLKNLPISFIEEYPEVPWSKIAGMRDLVTHSYSRINLDYVWKVIKEDLQDLKKNTLKIKKELEKSKK